MLLTSIRVSHLVYQGDVGRSQYTAERRMGRRCREDEGVWRITTCSWFVLILNDRL